MNLREWHTIVNDQNRIVRISCDLAWITVETLTRTDLNADLFKGDWTSHTVTLFHEDVFKIGYEFAAINNKRMLEQQEEQRRNAPPAPSPAEKIGEDKEPPDVTLVNAVVPF